MDILQQKMVKYDLFGLKIVEERYHILICSFTFVAEPNFIQIVELLHVPLQTMYNHRHKTSNRMANGEAIETLEKV